MVSNLRATGGAEGRADGQEQSHSSPNRRSCPFPCARVVVVETSSSTGRARTLEC